MTIPDARPRKINLRFEWDDRGYCFFASLKCGRVYASVDQPGLWCGNPETRVVARFPTEAEARAYVERVVTEAIEQAMEIEE